MGGHLVGYISAFGEMHSPNGDREDVTATSLLIGGEGELSVDSFQLNDQSTW